MERRGSPRKKRCRGISAAASIWIATPALPTAPVPAESNISVPEVDVAGASRADRAADLRLRALPGDRYRYVGTSGERFNATIAADGTVTMEVDPSIQLGLDSLCMIVFCVPSKRGSRRRSAGPQASPQQQTRSVGSSLAATALSLAAGVLASEYRDDDFASTRRQRGFTPRAPPMGVGGATSPSTAPNFGGASGSYGYLPKPHAQMGAFLARTFEFRLELAKKASAKRAKNALRQLPIRLLDVWTAPDRSPEERRAGILALWDDLSYKSIDAPLQAAARAGVDLARLADAQRARAIVLNFVRRHLPRGSTHAFPPAQLKHFNIWQADDAQFDPYAPPGPTSRREGPEHPQDPRAPGPSPSR